MADIDFKLPDVGEGVAEGELVSWLVEPGDTVAEDQPVAEVETDKALVEVPSPYDGTVKELHAEEGEMVPVGAVIITYDVPDADEDQVVEAEVELDEGDGAEAETAAGEAEAGEAEAEAGEAATAAGEADADSGEAAVPEGRVFAPPSARRLARELGVDIAAVEGSGPGGRVTEGDVRKHAAGDGEAAGAAEATTADESAGAGEAETAAATAAETAAAAEPATTATAAATAAPQSVETADRDRTLTVPKTRKVADELDVDLEAVPTDETRDGQAFVTEEQVREFAEARQAAREAEVAGEAAGAGAGEAAGAAGEAGAEAADTRVAARAPGERHEETIPYRGVRRTIGEKMEESKYTAPHVTHHDTAVVDDLVELREELKPRAEERGVHLTYMPFVMKAIVAALREFPVLNSTLDEEAEEIRVKHYYNLGVAVATEAGLMVPVVDDVAHKSVLELADEVNDKASRARERKLSLEEMQGGTFSITNFGAIGGEYATPIINYPETAILGLGAIEDRPVARDGEVVAAKTLPLSLSIDHRVIDGAEAAEFANEVIRYLENPQLLLLE